MTDSAELKACRLQRTCPFVAGDRNDKADHLRVDKVVDADKVVLVEDSADQEAPVVDQEAPEDQVAQVARAQNVPVVQISKFLKTCFCSMLMLKAEVRKHSGEG